MRKTGPRSPWTRALLATPAIALVFGLAVALTGPVSVALAAPTPSTLTSAPTHGLVNATFTLAYIADVDPATGGCGKGADVTWDGVHLTSSLPPVSLGAACAYPFNPTLPLAGHDAPGVHTLVAIQCTNFAPLTCTTVHKASTTYRVDTATVKVSPTTGLPTEKFTATYSVPKGDCAAFATVQFRWDSTGGALLGSAPMNTATCAASLSGIVPSAGASPGPHVVTGIACIAALGCNPATAPAKPPKYTVKIPATITVAPTSGLVTASFTATYTLTSADCSWTKVRFGWDGTLVPGWTTAMVQGTCSATLTLQPSAGAAPGMHHVTAEACATGAGTQVTCQGWTAPKTAAPYTITAPTASATPAPTPIPSPSPSATATASLPPAATAEPTAGPTSSPAPASTPIGAVGGATGSPDPWLPAIAPTIPGPSSLRLDLPVLATNAFLALLFVLLFGLTSEVLNSTLDEHRSVVEGWADRLVKRRLRFLRPLARADAWIDSLGQRGRAGALAQIGVVLALLGIVYGFLSEGFGLNKAGLVLVLSMMVGLAVILYLNYGGKALLIERFHHAPATVRAYGSAIFIAAICVIASRWLDFHPGLLYGFVATTVILRPIDLTPRSQARMVLGPAIAVLAASLIAWALLDPLRAATGDADAFFPALAQAVLGIVFIGGLESLLFGLLPVKFMDGAKVMRWSRRAWALTYFVVVFLWWQLLLNRDEAYVNAFRQTGVVAVFAMLGFFMATTGVVWFYFWRRDRAEEVAEAANAAETAIPQSDIQSE